MKAGLIEKKSVANFTINHCMTHDRLFNPL